MSEQQKPEIILNMGGIEIRPKSEEEFIQIMDEWQDAMIVDQLAIAKEFEVSDQTAMAIQYLRSRSRWTQIKEDMLIEADHAGNPIPLNTVLCGDF